MGDGDLGSLWYFQNGEAVGSAPVVIDPATGQATAVFTHRFAERGEFRITADYSGVSGSDEELAPSETAGATVVTVLPSRIEIDKPGPPSNEIYLSFGPLDLGSVMDVVGTEGSQPRQPGRLSSTTPPSGGHHRHRAGGAR